MGGWVRTGNASIGGLRTSLRTIRLKALSARFVKHLVDMQRWLLSFPRKKLVSLSVCVFWDVECGDLVREADQKIPQSPEMVGIRFTDRGGVEPTDKRELK